MPRSVAVPSLREMLNLEMIELVAARLHVVVPLAGGEDNRYTMPDEAIVDPSHAITTVVKLFISGISVLCQGDTFSSAISFIHNFTSLTRRVSLVDKSRSFFLDKRSVICMSF